MIIIVPFSNRTRITPVLSVNRNNTSLNLRENKKTHQNGSAKVCTAFNELFIKPIRGLYMDQAITVEEFKERNATLMKNRWIDTQHGSSGEKIYKLY